MLNAIRITFALEQPGVISLVEKIMRVMVASRYVIREKKCPQDPGCGGKSVGRAHTAAISI